MMWYQIFKFELAYRIKRPDTYVFFLFLFLFSIVGVDFIFQGVELGGVKKNAPLVIAKTMGAITGIFMILSSMIMGVAVLRDFQYQIESLIFVNPISKKDYLLGRFLGSFVVLLFIFSGILFGSILGEFMPWQDRDNYLEFSILPYLASFVTMTLPTLFFGASLFFVSGALSKKLVVVYTQGIILFVIFMLTKAITNDFWQAILDPFSLTTTTFVTNSWSALEKNIQLIPFSGALLYNKLFWIVLGVLALWFGYWRFNFSVIGNKRSKRTTQVAAISHEENQQEVQMPSFNIEIGIKSKLTQLIEFTRFYFMSIVKLPSFWAIVICGMIIIIVNSVNLGTVHGVDSVPATYFIVEELQETSIYFFMILLLFYSGELIWKERMAQLNLIYDASPMSSFVNLLGKYFGLLGIYIVLILALIISGVVFQTMSGYYAYELQVYFYGFFFEILPFLALYTLIAFFLQSVVNNKFLAIFLVLVFFILVNTLDVFGFGHDLYLFGGDGLATYSDMNGYGHFLKPFLVIKTYWFLFGMGLLIIASLVVVRGTETKFFKRLAYSKNRMSQPLLKLSGFIGVSFLVLGSYIFYNTNVLNEYWTSSEAIDFRVGYEQTLKPFEYIPQPKIVDVNVTVELYPSERNYSVEGYYILKNTTDITIADVHVQKLIESNVALEYVTFEEGARVNREHEIYDYHIYTLGQALQPGDSVQMNFKQTFTSNGFPESISNENIVENGTFFNNNDFPTIGYNKKYELSDKDRREEYQLAERSNKAAITDADELKNARSGGDADGIDFEMIIGTEIDQTALAPGNLIKQWEQEGRNYFHYKMKEPIINFYSIVSARYEVAKDTWTPKSDTLGSAVDLEIYYHNEHDKNLDRMMTSMMASFDYYSVNFSPYQYEQLRIMEFPRYAEFAQSFPGTVPFSEAIGFVLDIDDKEDVDMVFFITAHELAHQWFGMQVEAANVQGRNFILETLSQYAALMVFKESFSEEKVQQFLELQKTRYLDGKRRNAIEEPSLTRVGNQDYVYYAKGAIQMYKLQQAIGEDNVNLALRNFMRDWNSKDGLLKQSSGRYATSEDLLGYFKKVTNVESQELLEILFESVEELELKK